jgi:flagellar assembly factor FliW
MRAYFGRLFAEIASDKDGGVPQAQTQRFGVVDYREEDAIEFPAGLPAFEQERLFLAMEPPRTKPLIYLQSLARPELCFVTLPLLLVDPAYRLAVGTEDLRILGLTDLLERGGQPEIGRDVEALAIMSVTNSRPTANLLAPVIVRKTSEGGGARAGVQAIRVDREYSHEHAWGLGQADDGVTACS